MDSNIAKLLSSPAQGDSAVIACIVATQRALVIRQPDRNDPCLKFPGGTVEPGESVLQALIRETDDETGFKIPYVQLDDGTLILGDKNISVEYLGSKEMKSRGGSHDQHQFLVRVADEMEMVYLDGQIRKEDDEETIETSIRDLSELEKDRNFLWKQLELLRRVIARTSEPQTQVA